MMVLRPWQGQSVIARVVIRFLWLMVLPRRDIAFDGILVIVFTVFSPLNLLLMHDKKKKKGAVVGWSERLDYGVESRRKAWVRGCASPCDDFKTLSVNPAVNGYFLRIREGQDGERRKMGSAFHQLCPRYSETLTPTAPTAIRLWDTFTFF